MNDLQKEELNLLKAFLSICEKHSIKYFLVCGSALGAVKYHGFIPWDDDIDVGLFRDDYERFLEIAPAELTRGLFLQNSASESNSPFIYSKLRESNTTYIEKSASDLNINHGVYIDIFPLDGYPMRRMKMLLFELKKQVLKRIISSAFIPNKWYKKMFLYPVRKIVLRDRLNYYVNKYSNHVKHYYLSKSEYVCNHGNWQGKLEYAPKEQYGNGVMMEFEGLTVRVPERYDEYLTQKYGDWRADLPKDQQVGHHYAEVIDLSRPYTDYIEHLKNGKIRIKRPN